MLACCIPGTQTRDKGPDRDWKGRDSGRDWDPGIHMHTRKSPERSPLTDARYARHSHARGPPVMTLAHSIRVRHTLSIAMHALQLRPGAILNL